MKRLHLQLPILQLFAHEREGSYLDYDAVEFLEAKLKEMDISKDVIGSLLEKLNETAEDRKQEALRLKTRVKEAGKDTVIDHIQDKMIRSIERMSVDELNSLQMFLELAYAKMKFIRHASKINHPEYRRDEIMMESLSKVVNTEAENAYECEVTYRTRIRASSEATARATAGGDDDEVPAPTMENITQRGINGGGK